MKRLLLSLPLLALLFATSCNDDIFKQQPEESGQVIFNAKIQNITRATDVQFETNDEISIFASQAGGDTIGTYAYNLRYKFDGSFFRSDYILTYPESGNDLQFYAIYPYGEYSVPYFTHTVNSDQRNHADYTASDLMTASAVGNRNEIVDLTFTHRMSKIVINISSGNMPAGEQMLTFKNIKQTASVNLNANTYYANDNTVGDVIAAPNGTNSFKALFPPQIVTGDSVIAVISIGGEEFRWFAESDMRFHSGIEYVYNLDIDEENNIAFVTQINPWEEPKTIFADVAGYVENMRQVLYNGNGYWSSHDDFGIPAIKLSTDLWCEDIAYYNDQHFFSYDYHLDFRMGNYRRTNSTWNQLYYIIDFANEIIRVITTNDYNKDENYTEENANRYLSEAYALRAYAYFNLVNLWQHPYRKNPEAPGVPVKTESEDLQHRVPVKDIYSLIISDLDKAYKNLEGLGYGDAGKAGISEYSVAAIYANVLMFTGDYENAAKYAEAAIAGGNLNNEADMLSGFNSLDMAEVIWGYDVTSDNTTYYASFFSHVDAYMNGYGGAVGYRKLIASDLYNKIAENDVRKGWFGYNENYNLLQNDFSSEQSLGFDKYIPNKFRDIYLTSNGNAGEYTSDIIYTRIAEMYFVAAEAYYLAGNEHKAKEMLNAIMVTRVPDYSCTMTGEQFYNEICIQKRIEMWMEGCRLFDAKRRGETINREVSENHSATALDDYGTRQYKADEDYRMRFHFPEKVLENNPDITDNE